VADGTGLGLFIVKGFAEVQGGEVSLRNLPKGGAAFTLDFPTTILPQNLHNQ
jgi:signal transduction histidine kinase